MSIENRSKETKTRTKAASEYADFSKRLNELVQKLGIEKKDFARAGEIAPQTLTGYLDGTSQPKQEVLANWFRIYKVNLNWLLAGHGEMLLTEEKKQTRSFPKEELSQDLTPEQRNMLTYKRLQTELGTDTKQIAKGIDAIVMGKCVREGQNSKYGCAEEKSLNGGTVTVQEDGAEFGG